MQDNIDLSKDGSGFTIKSLIISVLLIPLNCYWIVLGESVYASYTPRFLMAMRANFMWWSLHPIGYAISGSWAMGTIWVPIFIRWFAKWSTIKYGGLRLHRKFIPFFLGLILGDFIAGSIWSLIGLGLDIYTYKIWV